MMRTETQHQTADKSAGQCVCASASTNEREMSTNSYDSEPFGIRHFSAPYDMPSCFLLETDMNKAQAVQMEDGLLSCLA